VAGLTLDAGALIAYERGQERIRKILAVSYERGLVPTIPAVAVAEVWRGDAKDARVARLLKASSLEILNDRIARAAGSLRRSTRRELNRLVDALESGDSEKFVLCQNNRMRAVVISLDTFSQMRVPQPV
jgi:hypothetical protein